MPQPKKAPLHQQKRIDLPLQTRLASVEASSSADNAERTFNVVFTTGAKVRRYDYMNDEAYDEELSVDPASMRMNRLNSGAPVLDTHGQYALNDVIGVVVPGSARVENGLGRATLKIDGGEENAGIVRKIKDGIIQNVSVGYRVHKYEIIRGDGVPPVYRATDWEPHEISLVPIGADAGAGIRSAPPTYPCEIFQPHPQPNLKENTMPDNDTTNEPNAAANAAAADPAAANQPENPDNDPAGDATETAEGERAEGVRLERARVLEIQKIVRAASLPESEATRMINSGTSLKKARKDVLNELAKRSAEGGEIRTQVTITRDEMDTCRGLVENALLHRYKPDSYKLEDGGRQFRGMSLLEIGRDLLERRGLKTRGMARAEVAGYMLGLDTRSGGLMGVTDFPFILANVANKTLRAAYEAAPQTFKPFCRPTTNPDFKNIARTQLGDAPSLDMINEGGEFKRGFVSDAREQYALATYGKVVPVSRQVIINDDLSAFTRLPEMFGRAAADLESDTVWGIITANANMGDGNALFSAPHGNLAGTGAVMSVTTLGAARQAMRQQKGLNGRYINVQPKFLLVPSAQETLAQQYVTQTNIIYTKSTDYNPFANLLQVLAEPRLDATSTISWYTAADPGQIDTIEYCYLEGQEGVYLENRVGFDIDGVELKARLDFAAKALDWRGFYKNPGA